MAQAPDNLDPTDLITAQFEQLGNEIDQLLLEIEQAEERLLSLEAKLSLMEDQAGAIRWDVRTASVYRRLHSGFEHVPAAEEEVLRTALSR
jgi:hypothetical protein